MDVRDEPRVPESSVVQTNGKDDDDDRPSEDFVARMVEQVRKALAERDRESE